MKIKFVKYQGTGNDFVLIDDRAGNVVLTTAQVAALCHRRFGIGADGLMLLQHCQGHDFKMVYFNADGNESTMCGNGGRCITAFARDLGLIKNKASFVAVDGAHTAIILEDGQVSLQMNDVQEMIISKKFATLNTGSPHYVQWVDNVSKVNVFADGYAVRHRPEYEPAGINVNFVQTLSDQRIKVRTYERGVEDETYSCGTGVTAAAIAVAGHAIGSFNTAIETPGGILQVSFTKHSSLSATNIKLIGPAVRVFEGEVEI